MIKKIITFLVLIFSITLMISVPISASDNSNEKIIYLTFDDGPSKKVLPKILDTLKKEEVKATFFIIGNEIKGREEILKEFMKRDIL